MSNQVRYARDFPAQDFGSVRVAVAGMPPGTYRLNVYRVGYQVNDVFDSYLKMGAPAQLTREQVATLAAGNSGRPVTTTNITIDPRQTFTRDFAVRENEAYLVTLDTIITR